MSTIFRGFVSCMGVAACVLTATYCDAQVLQWRRNQPVQPVPTVQPAPVQAVPAQPVQQPQPAPQPQQPVQAEANAQVQTGGAIASQNGQGQYIHGHSLIGQRIMGTNDQPVGTIQDFVVESQPGGCPTIFFAVAPQVPGWNEGYVIVPFDAFQISYDQQRRTDLFRLGIAGDALIRAPHLAVNSWNAGAWSSAQDRHYFADSRQFFQRTERTAARPETDGNREGANREGTREQNNEQRPQLPNNRKQLENPQRSQQPGTQPGTTQQPSNEQHGQPAPETRSGERQPEAGRQNERGNTPPAPEKNQGRSENERR